MPIIKSAKKRVRTAEKAAIRNAKTKRFLKGAVKSFQKAVDGGDTAAADTAFRQSQSGLDKALKKKLMHQNKVARLKRQLAAKAKALAGATSEKPKAAATAAKKAAKPGNVKAKDTPTKKAATASKKPAASSAAKKTTVKKPADKKKAE
jgi:small subunit ribosomal protein S20